MDELSPDLLENGDRPQGEAFKTREGHAGGRPPPLHLILADSNDLQPNKQQLDEALSQSRSYWRHIFSVAEIYHHRGLESKSVDPQSMLQRVPRMRGRQKDTFVIPSITQPWQILCFWPSTVWNADESTTCDALGHEHVHTIIMHIGIRNPVPYTLDGDGFSHWVGTEQETAVGPNYLAILTLGWSYVLSARLVELQGKGAALGYTGQKAPICSDETVGMMSDAASRIDIGVVGGGALSWWLAILASQEGWRAIVKEQDNAGFLAPWSMKSLGGHSLHVICQQIPTGESSPTPLSSSAAFSALVDFALSNNLGSQFLVAFTSAIMIPIHNNRGSTVRLPRPSTTGSRRPSIPQESIPPEWTALREYLDYYISLSCNPEAILSSLCGMFWEPGVPCNLVSPWLHPILDEMPVQLPNSPDRNAEILAIIGGIRRPPISALWLGAVATGLTPLILHKVRDGRPPLDPVAFPWTGSPQSFMDITGTGPYHTGLCNDHISRADVWRLMYLPTNEQDDMWYRRPPDTPWEPVGNMEKKSCALRVASHFGCPRHPLRYQHLNWEVEGCPVISDRGLSPVGPVPFQDHTYLIYVPPEKQVQFSNQPMSLEASMEASTEVFHWFVRGGEGFPSEAIYKHEWLDPIRDDDDEYEETSSHREDETAVSKTFGADKRLGLEHWLQDWS